MPEHERWTDVQNDPRNAIVTKNAAWFQRQAFWNFNAVVDRMTPELLKIGKAFDEMNDKVRQFRKKA